jgi:CRISPR/Cas system CMR-associated protein Cmr3 (group 5 of RAMP superfamily)
MNSELLNLINLVQNQLLLLPGVTSVGFCNENKLLTLEASENINTIKVETLIFKAGYRMKVESITPKIQLTTGNKHKSFVLLSIRLYNMFPIMPFSRS